jgi:hypothetical protein
LGQSAVSPGWRKSSYSSDAGGSNCVEVGATPWRKSTYSSGGGGSNCVEVGATPWRKSTYSSGAGGSNCVEAGHVPGAVLIRDTKDHGAGPVLRVTPHDWHRLTSAIRANAPLR